MISLPLNPGYLLFPQKPAQFLADGSRRRLIEPPYAPVDAARFDARDLGRAHDGRHGQSCASEIGDGNIARPWLVAGAGDHGDPNEAMDRELAVGDDEHRAALLRRPAGMGKRQHDDSNGA